MHVLVEDVLFKKVLCMFISEYAVSVSQYGLACAAVKQNSDKSIILFLISVFFCVLCLGDTNSSKVNVKHFKDCIIQRLCVTYLHVYSQVKLYFLYIFVKMLYII